MLTASPITRQTVGKTFSIAISTLGIASVLQVGVIGWAFATRPVNAVAGYTAANPQGRALANPSATAPSVPTPDFSSNPLGELAQTAPATPAPGPQKPTPVPQKAAPEVPTNRFEEVLLQGKQLRERGDMNTAITKFREAAAMDPRNPIAIAELAATYEKLGNADRAGEQWRKIYEMGDGAGVYFSLAETKLKISQVQALAAVARPTGDVPPEAAGAGAENIASGATLGLLGIRAEEQASEDAAKRFTLHIPIKARPKTKMEVRDLVIHVLFYDLVDGQNVVQTSANVNSRWMTPPADWLESDVEELAVEYQLPKPEAKAAKRENRKYFGYIVRIYYKQQLQAATAEPERLSQQYPPPPTLPKDPDK